MQSRAFYQRHFRDIFSSTNDHDHEIQKQVHSVLKIIKYHFVVATGEIICKFSSEPPIECGLRKEGLRIYILFLKNISMTGG